MEKYSSGRRGVTRKQTALVTVYFPKPLWCLAFTDFDPRQCKQVVYSFLSKFRQSNNTEKYSSGRRGVTRNLVGRESVAWVQIPPSPPKKDCPLVGQSFFAGEGACRNHVAATRRRGGNDAAGIFPRKSQTWRNK